MLDWNCAAAADRSGTAGDGNDFVIEDSLALRMIMERCITDDRKSSNTHKDQRKTAIEPSAE
jgi:hypothetical protein